jgi:hypothetical protein
MYSQYDLDLCLFPKDTHVTFLTMDEYFLSDVYDNIPAMLTLLRVLGYDINPYFDMV